MERCREGGRREVVLGGVCLKEEEESFVRLRKVCGGGGGCGERRWEGLGQWKVPGREKKEGWESKDERLTGEGCEDEVERGTAGTKQQQQIIMRNFCECP